MPPQASRDRPPYEPSTLFAGKYAIRRILGEGGMAVVYSAVDTSCDRQVAIKVLRPSAAAHRHLSSGRVQREAATVVKLHERTPHVVEVLTAGVSEDQHRLPYYVMERLYGTTLREGIEAKRRAGQPFDYIEVASTVTEIAVALAYAHDMGIVHRDIKPENVFIAEQRDRSYMIKLLDFGVAALLADEDGPPASRRAFSGSRQYASPEQLDGQPPAPACDVYAMGLILFEMLTFSLPHDRSNRALIVPETALNVLRDPMPNVKKLRPDIPPRLENLVRDCLQYEPAQRLNALQVANNLRFIKQVLEGKLVGINETQATDVSGPPTGMGMRFGDSFRGTTQAPVQRMGGTVPVDPNASTDPGAQAGGAPADHEVFFMNRVADTTERLPTTGNTTAVPKTLPLNAPRFEARMLAPPPQPATTLPLVQPPVPAPSWVASQSVEPFASRTQPESTPALPGRKVGPALVFAAILVVCVGMLGIAGTRMLLHRAAAPSAAVSTLPPSASSIAPPATEIPAASAEPVASLQVPSASSAPAGPSSSSPAHSSRPPVAPMRRRPHRRWATDLAPVSDAGSARLTTTPRASEVADHPA